MLVQVSSGNIRLDLFTTRYFMLGQFMSDKFRLLQVLSFCVRFSLYQVI
jgi:hypothetical protein